MGKTPPKTTWCQHCAEDRDDLRLYNAANDRINWVCEDCIKEIEKQRRQESLARSVTKPMTKKQLEKEKERTRRVSKLMKSRSSGERKLAPGEKLPEVSVDYSFGSQPLRSKETPMDYYVGFRWSYGHGPNEEEDEDGQDDQ